MNDQRAYFDEPSHRYPEVDALTPPLAQILEMEHLQHVLGMLSGNSILDFGSGSGRVTFWFLKKGYNVTAVDISPKSLSSLVRHYKQHKQSWWGILKASARLPKARFDAIVGADILHHLDMHDYLPKLYRSLKPGGRIAFSEPNAWFLPWYGYIFLRRLPWSIEKGILQMTVSRISRALKDAGFQHVYMTGFPSLVWFRIIVSAQKRGLPLHQPKQAHP